MWNAVRKWAVFKRKKKSWRQCNRVSRRPVCLSVPYGKWIQTEGQEHSSMFLANTSSPLYFLPFRTNESLSLQITCDHRFKLTLLGFCEWGFLINSTVPFYFKLLWFLLPYMLSCFTAFVQKLFDYLIFKKNLSKIEIWYNDQESTAS